MRRVLLMGALAGLMVIPVFAQRGGRGGGFMPGGDFLLTLPAVQKELKLDDKQKEAVAEITKKQNEARKKAFEDMDFSELGKVMQESQKALAKIRKELKPAQAKRLDQLEVQLAVQGKNPEVFKRDNVAKALNLTTKQKETIKSSLDDLEKDAKELREEAKGDRQKMREIFQKINKLRQETYAKITKSFSEDQTKAFKDLQGDKFEFPKMGFGPGGKGGKKKKDKSDF
jgi:hypothetical protein